MFSEASDLVPEDVVVLETVGTVDDFIRAVERVPEMEYRADVEAEAITLDDDYFSVVDDVLEQPTKAVPRRLFMVFTNQSAQHQMVSLWNDWLSGSKLAHGLANRCPLSPTKAVNVLTVGLAQEDISRSTLPSEYPE